MESLITKTSVLSDQEIKFFFWFIRYFQRYKRAFEGLFLKQLVLEKKAGFASKYVSIVIIPLPLDTLKVCGDSIFRPLNIIFKTCLRRVNFAWNGKKPILFQFITKVIRKLLWTTVLFRFYRFVVKYLNHFL